jgi:hypothetical protein
MAVPPEFELLVLLYHWYVMALPLGLDADTLNAVVAAFKQTDWAVVDGWLFITGPVTTATIGARTNS